MIEDPTGQNLNTDYVFDTLGNLRKTTQGEQSRYFTHDSLGRLLYAKQPEQEANTNFNYTDSITNNTSWSVKYLYDDNGNITSTTDARGVYVQGTYDNFNRLKKDLLPPLDKGVSALLDDLASMGLLDDTMVVVMGEFGRTPKVNKNQGGRDHWARCFSAAFAGGGVRGGQVIGKSDKTASDPTTTPFALDDVGATIYHQLGVDHTSEVKDRTSRPVQLNRGTVMQALFNG